MMINVVLILAVSVLAAREILGVSNWYVDDAYFERLNPEGVDVNTTNLEVVWINSTLSGIAANITTLKDMPPGTMIHLNMFEKKNGEFKTHSGISVSQPYCKIMSDPVIFNSLLTSMNATQCPLPAGTYSIPEYFVTSNSFMPDYLPTNQYRMSIVIRTKRTVFLQAYIFLSIS